MCMLLRTERAAVAPRKRLGDVGVSPHQKYTHNTRASLEIQACPFCLFVQRNNTSSPHKKLKCSQPQDRGE